MFSSILNKYFELFSVDSLVSTIGQDFVFGFINNCYDQADGLLLAIVSNANDQPANVTVTSIYPQFQTINILIQPFAIEKVIGFYFVQKIGTLIIGITKYFP
jgi:hypothetical protein